MIAVVKGKPFLRLIGIGILLWLVSRVDLLQCWDIIKEMHVVYFLFAMLISLPLLMVKAYRWKFILKLQDIDYPFKKVFLSYLGSIYAGLITPGRIGEYAKIFYLRHDKHISVGKAFSSVLIDRLLDLFFLLSIAGAGVLVYYNAAWLYLSSFLVFMVVVILGLSLKNKYGMLSQFLFRMISSEKWNGLNLQMGDFLKGIEDLQKWKFYFAVFLTFVSYCLFFIRCYLIAVALGISINFFTFIFFMSLTSLAVLVPVSVAGLGTREGTLIFLFSQVAIPQEVALGFSLLILCAVNLWTGILGFMAWMVEPLPVASLKRNIRNSEEVRA